MKNILYYLAVGLLSAGILVFSASACTTAEQKQENTQQKIMQQVNQPFESTANISYKGVQAKVTMNRSSDGCYRVEFLQPAALSGCVLAVQGEQVSMTYQNMTLEMTADEFFDSSAVKMAIASINRAAKGSGLSFAMDNGTLTACGIGENGEFTLLLDPANGNMLSISIPSSDFEMTFENFKFLN